MELLGRLHSRASPELELGSIRFRRLFPAARQPMHDTATGPATEPALPLAATRVLALLATGLAAFLASQSTGDGVLGCDGLAGFSCSDALSSRWATWISMPVSWAGVAVYAGITAASWLVGRKSPSVDAAGWRLLELLAPAAAGAAVWFLGLQAAGVAPLCPYCLATHLIGLLAVAASLIARWQSAHSRSAVPSAPIGIGHALSAAATKKPTCLPPPALGLPTLGGTAVVVALVLGQLLLPPRMKAIDAATLEGEFNLDRPTTNASTSAGAEQQVSSTPAESGTDPEALESPPMRPRGEGERIITLLGGKLSVDTYRYPILGSPEAPNVVLELMNYSCSSCRDFHPILDEARSRYGDQLAVVVLPVPNEILCNKYVKRAIPSARGACKIARLAVAASETAPEQFERVHAFLLEGDTMPSAIEASIFAKGFIDSERLSEAIQSDSVAQRVETFIDLYAALSARRGMRMPIQILGDQILEGAPSSIDELCEAWEARLPGLARSEP